MEKKVFLSFQIFWNQKIKKFYSLNILCPGGVADSIGACRAPDPGSNPGQGVFILLLCIKNKIQKDI